VQATSASKQKIANRVVPRVACFSEQTASKCPMELVHSIAAANFAVLVVATLLGGGKVGFRNGLLNLLNRTEK
jgi:hypothetical protein